MENTLDLPEPIRILSDLHLGHPGCRILDPVELRPVIEGAATVIFNGDTLEERARKYLEKGRQLFTALTTLCEEAGVRPVFLTGNHDPITPQHHRLDLYNGRVFVTHGDAVYPDLSPWSKFHPEIVATMHRVRAEYSEDELQELDTLLVIAKRISRELRVRQPSTAPGFWGKVQTLKNETWPPKRPYRILKTWLTGHLDAHTFCEIHRPKARLCVVGHTHWPYAKSQGHRTIVNTGAFLPISRSTMVEIKGGRACVRPIIRRRREFAAGRVTTERSLSD